MFTALWPHLNERQRRLLLAAEARHLGRGGVTRVALAAGVSRQTVHQALHEVEAPPGPSGRVRRPGGGRKKTAAKDPQVVADLEALVDPQTRGDPMSPLRWTCKSTRQLGQALAAAGHQVSHRWPNCCIGTATVCKRQVRREKAPSIPTEMPSFAT